MLRLWRRKRLSADPGWPEGVACHELTEVDSTSAEAERLAPSLSGPTWIIAERQTAARGRRGRPWVSAEGNFAATLLMHPSGGPEQAAMRSFIAALALADALVLATGRAEAVALKWPNDVLLNGGKVAGILLESVSSGTGVGHLAIGIGVNLADAPGPDQVEPGALSPVSVSGETGVRVAPREFLTLLAAAFDRWDRQFHSYGFAPIRTAWLARAARHGQRMTARTMTETHEGIFDTLDDTGALVLATAKGRIAIRAADVFF